MPKHTVCILDTAQSFRYIGHLMSEPRCGATRSGSFIPGEEWEAPKYEAVFPRAPSRPGAASCRSASKGSASLPLHETALTAREQASLQSSGRRAESNISRVLGVALCLPESRPHGEQHPTQSAWWESRQNHLFHVLSVEGNCSLSPTVGNKNVEGTPSLCPSFSNKFISTFSPVTHL